MRKFLMLLSAVLLFAICQGQLLNKKFKPGPHKFRPVCPFGSKKVNKTRVCLTKEEFLANPRNQTNCTKHRNLVCNKFGNATYCFCLRNPKGPSFPTHVFRKCPLGTKKTCTKDKLTRQQTCVCEKLGPTANDTSVLRKKDCGEGYQLRCNSKGCFCRKTKERKPVLEPAVGLF